MKLLVYRWEEKNGSKLVGAIEFPFASDTPITEDLLRPAQDDEDLQHLRSLINPGIKLYSPQLQERVSPADGWDYLETLALTSNMHCEIQVTKADLKKYGIEDEDDDDNEGDGEPEGEPVAGDPDMDEFYATTHFTERSK
jgi:hypothetical protein